MQEKKIVIFGATGFIGRHLIAEILKSENFSNVSIYAVSRSFNKAEKLSSYGAFGKVRPVSYNPKDIHELENLLKDADVVINATGVLMPKKPQEFFNVHYEFPKQLAELCKKHHIARFIHLSAIGAQKDSQSRYAHSKALGEEAILQAFPDAVIYRPSIIVGKDDHFLSQFGQMASNMRFLPVPTPQPDGALFAPIWVMDVAKAITTAIKNPHIQGIYELQGSKTYSWRALMQLIAQTLNVSCKIVSVPSWFLRIGGVTKDQMILLSQDNIASPESQKIEDLGLKASPIEPMMYHMLQAWVKG